YDYCVSQYSPDGKIFQIDYAKKAVDNSSTAIGICFKNGVVLAVEKETTSILHEKNSFNRIFHIDTNIGMAISGLTADARQIVAFARKECKSHRELYGSSIPITSRTLSPCIHHSLEFTPIWMQSPSVLLAAYEDSKPLLYCVDASGSFHGYNACAIGKDKVKAESLLEKVDVDIFYFINREIIF
ncbi:hypothetical protein MXB_5417, partial [Myxobolus squamalis]